ncbi:MAG: DNA replication and repair protein RecF [Candidatus Zixiibacteriota bacterium]
MAVHSLALTNFRNLRGGTVRFGAGSNVLYGANGSGKTNLLEAIFMVCLGRSQRGAADAVLLGRDADFFRLEGEIESGSNRHKLAVAYQRGFRKKLTIDTKPARAFELFELNSLVAAGPEDSEILSGPPSIRRLFLDLYISQHSTTYLADLTDYQRALTQKNAALRGELDATPFDPMLVEYGTKVILQRAGFLRSLGVRSVSAYARIAGGEQLVVEYQSNIPISLESMNVDSARAAFEAELSRVADRERAVQTSLAGPHRDEVFFGIGGLPARTHGSQGQWRTAAVALKLAVYDMLREKRGEPPVLLLDEIFAELDNDRTARLVESFGDIGQLFLTTAVRPPDQLMARAERFRLVDGQVMKE